LVRTAIGELKLETLDLEQGKWRFLSVAQLSLLAPSVTSGQSAESSTKL
jgi:16S rRNA U516 pseudouridylate synthase RsuA-like enzyme